MQWEDCGSVGLTGKQLCRMSVTEGLFLLVLFGMEVILSVWMVRRQKKQSLVEQMRAQS